MICTACGNDTDNVYVAVRVIQEKRPDIPYVITTEYIVCTQCANPVIRKILNHTYGAQYEKTEGKERPKL